MQMPTARIEGPVRPINNYFSRAPSSRQTRAPALGETNFNRILPEDNTIGWSEQDEAAVQKELTQLQLGQLRDKLTQLQQAAAAAKGNQRALRAIVRQVADIRTELQQIQTSKQKPVGPLSLGQMFNPPAGYTAAERKTLEKEAYKHIG